MSISDCVIAALVHLFELCHKFFLSLASCSLFLSSTNFVGCLNGVRFQVDIDAQIWAFLLRLSGHIVKQLPQTATTLDYFHEAVRTGFKETADQTDLWRQASIRCAWLQGMQLMITADHQLLSDGRSEYFF